MKYILDTNIISAILKGNEEVKNKFDDAISNEDEILINGICYYEIKRGLLDLNATGELKKFQSFCEVFGLVLLDSKEIFDEASNIHVNLKRMGRLTKDDADILIASITKTLDAILVTANTRDFENIQGLTLENWID